MNVKHKAPMNRAQYEQHSYSQMHNTSYLMDLLFKFVFIHGASYDQSILIINNWMVRMASSTQAGC